jgi:hypothetical protein
MILAGCLAVSCTPSLRVPQATRAERAKFKHQLITTTIEGALAQPLTRETEAKWQGAFWVMGLARYTSGNTTRAIHEAFDQWPDRSPTFQRALLEVVFTLYPDDFISEAEMVCGTTPSEKLFAMAAHQVWLATRGKDGERISAQMHRRFPGYSEHPILRLLDYEIQTAALETPPLVPPMGELLSAPIENGQPVIFSLQRKHRRFSGLALVRDANGQFVKLNPSTYFSIPQLALASSDLPGYLSNGNTPQGIFSLQGFGQSKNVFIGPTPNLQMQLPFEARPFEYFRTADKTDSVWTKERYAALLPAAWKNYLPIYTAFYAGEAGRTEIIAHGTTVDPEFYPGEPFFPNTPSLGCLSAVESWSPVDGRRVSSEQQKLVDVLKRLGFEHGYLVVVELNDEPRAVTLEDVLTLIPKTPIKP